MYLYWYTSRNFTKIIITPLNILNFPAQLVDQILRNLDPHQKILFWVIEMTIFQDNIPHEDAFSHE